MMYSVMWIQIDYITDPDQQNLINPDPGKLNYQIDVKTSFKSKKKNF